MSVHAHVEFELGTDTDYDLRSLAEAWSSTLNPPIPGSSHYRTPLSQISLFVLLDLLGAANPRIPSHFLETHGAYWNLASIEARMRTLRLLESEPERPFLPDVDMAIRAPKVADDHIPFLRRGVPVLHVIPNPFPDVWHTLEDDGENLDMPTTKDWAKIVTAL